MPITSQIRSETPELAAEPGMGSPARRRQGLFAMQDRLMFDSVWTEQHRSRLREIVDIPEWIWAGDVCEHQELLANTELLFSTWGMPSLTSRELDHLPKLKAVFYAAGSVKSFAGPLLERGITVISANIPNAIPVAEFTLSQIIFALKQGWQHHQQLHSIPNAKGFQELPITGLYGATVGIISLGTIGTKLCELLMPFDVQKLVYDPFVKEASLQKYDLQKTSLEALFAQSDVVTVHTPALKETAGLITGKLLESMKPFSTFINTSRGVLVKEDEMIEVLQRRPDITAILDVTLSEPPLEGSPLYHMPNVVLTPHIAGSKGKEIARMTDWIIQECANYIEGKPLKLAVNANTLAYSA